MPAQGRQHGRVLRLLHESRDPPIVRHFHDSECPRGLRPHRRRRHRDLRPGRDVLLEDLAKIHLVELIAGKNDSELVRIGGKVIEVLPHRVGRALIPIHAVGALLRRENLDESGGEGVEPIALLDVPVEGSTVELCEQEDPAQVRIEAIGDRYVHQTILAREGDRRFGPILGEREEPRARTTPHDHGENIMGTDGDVPGHGGYIRVEFA